MGLKIEVSMPTKSVRNADNCEDIIRHGLSFSDAFIETLESKIIIGGLPKPCAGTSARICLEYFEQYQPDTSLGSFFERAEAFAMNYCKAIGIGAE
ncbi:hypothetical protein [Serratia marcescens]|uniref:hypothetical protein n=1 Tax=Serratia marcescens TaxID=615 RepID=UPI00148C61AA|nr:hypothetical protein [Serratia marcescens]QJU39070.1 hypothetical protein HMI62_06925 [Serratia marcescens]